MEEPTTPAEAPIATAPAKKGPPKTAPPKPSEAQGDDGAKPKKKKAPPPPSGAPPKSAAAALRAKAGPPSSPPPKAVNASVQKIRATASADSKEAAPKPKKKIPPPPASTLNESESKAESSSESKVESSVEFKGIEEVILEKPKPKVTLQPKSADPVNSDNPVIAASKQHIVAHEKKAILDSMQGKRKTVTELLQEDASFRKPHQEPIDPPLMPKTVYTSVSSNTTGKAAPQSLSVRRDSVEEELTVLQVKKDAKPEAKLSDGNDDEDSMDEIEEIPILDAKEIAKEVAKAYDDNDNDDRDDPEIVIEKAPCDEAKSSRDDDDQDERAKSLLDNNSHDLQTSKAALTDALYQEIKELESMGKDAKPKRSKRNKDKGEEKKKSFELFNPKRVPYVPNHLLDFVTKPLDVGRGHIVRCFIERNRSGQNKISPLYTMLIEVNSSSGRPILYARKKPTSRISSHFIFSLNKDDLFLSRSQRSKQFVGKLRSDVRKMEYTLYDQGDNPEDIDSDCEIDEEIRQQIRAELAVIIYHPMKKDNQRKMEVILPAIIEQPTGEDGVKNLSYLDWRPISRDQALDALFADVAEQGGQNVLEKDKLICLHKRESKYDPLSSCIVDFRSRATCVSVKNFQLVHSQPTDQDKYRQAYIQAHPSFHYDDESTVSVPQEHIMLQMGRVGQNCFNMDFQYPLSMLQAFAICISRFDSKQK
ncbi:unnamed protein product [Aphanomyces euteiches]|uniref:Tubby C-terminal domain-containing protein n=1 Tax=Aphanomyces euteiches TaxID=100861 RepID=A0A6G0WMA0_9STRA|nr:hypothetical protein Ae201684_013787 [Aphanomyces euteiches]KAH9080908.1 hypothetical protein Ae201684P_007994 [Aphanomyces euteiches]